MSTSPIAPIQVRNPLGHNARAFVVSGSTKTKVPCVQSVSITRQAETVDLTTWDSGGWKKNVPGTKSMAVEMTILKVEGDAIQRYFYDAWRADAPSTIACEFISSENGEGANGLWCVTNIGDEFATNEGIAVKISLESYGEIEEVEAGTSPASYEG